MVSRMLILSGVMLVIGLEVFHNTCHADKPMKFARFRHGTTQAYGLVEASRIYPIEGDLFGQWKKTDQSFALADVTLLVPTSPRNVFAMAGNYKSHLNDGATAVTITTTSKVTFDSATGETSTESETEKQVAMPGVVPEKFQTPQPFFKTVSSLTAQDTDIVLPKDAEEVHYEAEMVVVMGRRASNVPKASALAYVLGVTCGNDVSARQWQQNDVQWWRAKGSDTFGPCGPFIVSGLDYDNLNMTLRVNGEVKQQESTRQLIHDVASTVSFISRHVTLFPGDLIFTGTPGRTSALRSGDVVEVELEGVGVLRNRVVAE